MIQGIEGIGNDIVHIPRIEKLIEEYGDTFLNRVYTAGEQAYAHQKAKGDARIFASTLAKRWAAKEATVKALGTGFGNNTYWNSIEIVDTDSAPTIRVHGQTDDKSNRQFLLSMSDDYPSATAFVIILR
jgi:holo-[acyl-carrier protein] synthase